MTESPERIFLVSRGNPAAGTATCDLFEDLFYQDLTILYHPLRAAIAQDNRQLGWSASISAGSESAGAATKVGLVRPGQRALVVVEIEL